jgi:hypothetical protein
MTQMAPVVVPGSQTDGKSSTRFVVQSRLSPPRARLSGNDGSVVQRSLLNAQSLRVSLYGVHSTTGQMTTDERTQPTLKGN